MRPSASLRATCVAHETGAARKLASLKQRGPLIPVSLRYSAPTEGTDKYAPWRVLVYWFPFPIPSVRAEERSFWRIRATCCLSEASSRGPRQKRAPQVARSEAEGRAQQGRLFFAYFLLAKQKKVSRPPGRIPASVLREVHQTCMFMMSVYA